MSCVLPLHVLKFLQNYCLRRCLRARPQNIDRSANKMVVFTNRPYIDTYLFVINSICYKDYNTPIYHG
jgi:hypothetical protein